MFNNLIGKILYKDSDIYKNNVFYILEDDSDEFKFASNLKKIKNDICNNDYPKFTYAGKIVKITGYIKLHYINSTLKTSVKSFEFENILFIIHLDNGKHVKCTLSGTCYTITTNKGFLIFNGMYMENNPFIDEHIRKKYLNNIPYSYIDKYCADYLKNTRKDMGISLMLYIEYPIDMTNIIKEINSYYMKDVPKNFLNTCIYEKIVNESQEKEILNYIKSEIKKYFNKIKIAHARFLKTI